MFYYTFLMPLGQSGDGCYHKGLVKYFSYKQKKATSQEFTFSADHSEGYILQLWKLCGKFNGGLSTPWQKRKVFLKYWVSTATNCVLYVKK